jgi:hypothetical protein
MIEDVGTCTAYTCFFIPKLFSEGYCIGEELGILSLYVVEGGTVIAKCLGNHIARYFIADVHIEPPVKPVCYRSNSVERVNDMPAEQHAVAPDVDFAEQGQRSGQDQSGIVFFPNIPAGGNRNIFIDGVACRIFSIELCIGLFVVGIEAFHERYVYIPPSFQITAVAELKMMLYFGF